MTKRLILFSLYSIFSILSQAQNFVYLNEKSEFTKKPNEAIGFAEIAEEGELKIVKFFTLDSILTRISQYSQFEKTPENISASFQETAVKILLSRLFKAVEDTGLKTIVAGGGVSTVWPPWKKTTPSTPATA